MKNLLLILAVLISFQAKAFCQWTKLNECLRGTTLGSIAINENKVYAMLQGNGGIFFQSDDLGKTWRDCPDWLKYSSLSFQANNNFILIRAFKYYYSTDSGLSWIELKPPANMDINHYSNHYCITDNSIFVTTRENGKEVKGIFRTSDFGDSWEKISHEFVNINLYNLSADGNIVFALSHENKKYDSTGGSKNTRNIYYSSDNGDNWNMTTVECFELHWGDGNKIIKTGGHYFLAAKEGIYHSTDNCNSWQKSDLGIDKPYIAGLAYNDSIIYTIAFYDGIYRTLNYGESWEKINNGLNVSYFSSIECKDSTVIVGTQYGYMYLSTNFGNTWKIISRTAQHDHPIATSVLADGEEIFASLYKCGIRYSGNGGYTWEMQTDDLSHYYIHDLKAQDNDFYACTDNGLYKSVDRGKNWDLAGFDSIKVTHMLVQDSILYTIADGILYVSFDNGSEWNSLGYYDNVWSVAIEEEMIYVGTYGDGIYKSTDGGDTWSDVSIGLTNTYVSSIAINDDYVFAGTRSGIFLSTDEGSSWRLSCSNDYPSTIKVVDGNIISIGRVVFISTNRGASWKTYNKGLENTLGNQNFFCIDSRKLYVCTHNWVYKIGYDELIISGIEDDLTSNANFQIFPNPAKNIININYSDYIYGEQIKIFNLLGLPLWSGIADGKSKTINISHLSSGVYFLQAGKEIKMFVKE